MPSLVMFCLLAASLTPHKQQDRGLNNIPGMGIAHPTFILYFLYGL
ncbi:hypothetical protein ACL6C3_29880 [Capilliphycus salinus ALCB114379]